MCALVLALRKVPIYAPGGGGEPLGGPTNPGYSVAISDSWATEAREKAAAKKEDKRLVPSKPAAPKADSDLAAPSEEKAAEAMNARDPTADAAHTGGAASAWNSRDDNTLGSRDESLERHRGNEIDSLREGLIKRHSTRGRRKPGEAMPAIPSLDGPGLMITQASPHREGFMGAMSQTLDEEAELGLEQTTSSQGGMYGNTAYEPYQVQAPGQNYSIYPPPSAGSRGAQQQPSASTQQSQGQLRRLSLGLKPSNSTSTRGKGSSQ